MTLIYFLLILTIIIFIHELGHFLFARLFGVHVYEFSLGMGPRLIKHVDSKYGTEYSLRLFPIGGYVRIAGEDDIDEPSTKEDKKLSSKTWCQRFIVTGAGSMFNMFLAIIIIFVLAITLGSVSTKPYIGKAMVDYPAAKAGIQSGDLVLSVNGIEVDSYDELIIRLYENNNKQTTFEVQKENGMINSYTVKPQKENGYYVYGITASVQKEYGLVNSINYTSSKFIALIKTMGMSLTALVTGSLNINQFSGPIGVYDMVDNQVASGIGNVAYFVAYLCINIGFINLLPIPALDGGRMFFLVIEKIKGSRVDPALEAKIHYLGFIFLMALILLITINDIFRIGG